jgi:PAS domain S-box-containing protein
MNSQRLSRCLLAMWKTAWLGTFPVLVSILVSVSGQLHAATEVSNPERISITYCTDCVPFHFRDAQGQPAGMIVELWRLWSKKTGIAIDFHPTSWSDSLQQVRDGRSQVHAGLFFNEQRDIYLDYGAVLANTDTHVFLHHTLPIIERVEDLAGYRTGVLAGDFVQDYLKQSLPDDAVIPYPSYDAILKDLRTGKLKAFAADTPTGIYHLKRKDLLEQFKISDNHLLYSNDWRLAVGQGNAHLLEVLNSGMAQISNEERAAVVKRWTDPEASKDKALITEEPQMPDLTATQIRDQASEKTEQVFSVWQLILWFVVLAAVLAILLLILKRLRVEAVNRIFEGRNLSYIVTVLVTAFLTVVLLVAWFALERMDRQLRAEFAETLVTINRSVKESMGMWLESRSREITYLTRDRELLPLIQQLLALPRDAEVIRDSQVLKRMRALYRYHTDEMNAEGFFIIARDHISIGSLRNSNIGTRNLIAEQQPELMQRAFSGEAVFIPPIYSDVPLMNASGRIEEKAATMFFASPVYDSNRAVIAVLALRFDPVSEFDRMTHVGQLGASGETYAFDRQARMLTESRFDNQLALLPDYFPSETQLLSMRILDPGGNLLKGYKPDRELAQWSLTKMAKAALNKRHGFDTSGYRDYRGVPVIGTWSWLDRMGIGLATEIDLSEALEPYHAMRKLVLGALGGIVFIALLLTVLTVLLGERARSRLRLLVNERTEELRKVVQAVEQSPLCVVITDITGTIEHVNPTFTRVTGYESHEVVGKNSRVLKSGETPPQEYDLLWETILSGKVWQSEIRNRKKKGELYWASISIAPVKSDAGKVTHFVAMTDDITHAKRAESYRQQAEDELARQRIMLTSIIDTIPDWVFVKDEDGRFTHINSAQAEFMGLDREELLGTTAHDHFSSEAAGTFDREDRKVLQGDICRNSEWLTFPNGSKHLMDTTKVPFHGSEGSIDGILGISRDITAQHTAEAGLKASMARFQVLFDQSSDPHLILAEDKVIECNTAAVEMLCCKDKQQLLSRQPSTFSPEFQPDGRKSAEKADEMYAITREKGSHRFDWTHRRINGEEFLVQVTMTQITLDGRPAILGVWNDLTEHKAVEKALEKAREAADAANLAKSEFLANMSHELRTPMNAVLGYSEILMEEAEDAGQQGFIPDLKKINQAGTHLLALINDVLDLSKIESGKMEAFPEEIILHSLIDEVAATAHLLLGKNNNKLAVERGKNMGNAFQDLTKLRQVLLNLLSNAAKFTHEGTVTLHAIRLSRANGDWLIFAVSDTGIGIEADMLERVFEEFSQADNSTTRDYGGTGLGLTIARRFCKLLGGSLDVYSEPGEGSTFTIRIPAELPDSKQSQPVTTTSNEIRT